VKGITLIQFTAQTAVTRPAQPLYPSTSLGPSTLCFIYHLLFTSSCSTFLASSTFNPPSSTCLSMVVLQQLNTERDGVALESISDKIDKINVLKDQARKQMNRLAAESDNAYKESKSDSEKDGQGGRAR
jgi:hypothetical protein